MGKSKNKNKNKKDMSKTRENPSGEYRVGTLGDMIVASCGISEPEFDPKLVSLFSNTKKAKKVMVNSGKSSTEAMPLPPPPPIRGKIRVGNNNRYKDDGELRNKDAASIRVGVKSAANADAKQVRVPPVQIQNSSSKELKRLKHSKKRTDDGKKQRHRARQNADTVQTRIIEEKVFAEDEETNPHDDEATPEDSGSQLKIKKDKDPESIAVKHISHKNKGTVGEIKKSLKELNAPKEKNPELEARTLFVGNVPKTVKKKQLLKLLRPFGGSIETIRLRCAAPDKPTTMKKVAMNKKELHPDIASIAAYVRFQNREEVQGVLDKAQSQGLTLGDHHLVFDFADRSLKKDNKKAVFVGNLPLKSQDDELWELFSDCGQIESVRVVRDRDSGLGKGFGYVNFMEASSVVLALEKDGTDFNNRSLRISRCVKKLKKIENGPGPTSTSTYGNKSAFRNAKPFKPEGRNNGKPSFEIKKKRNDKKISQGMRQRKDVQQFSGDRTAEVGKFKRNSKKPNQEDRKKVRMAKQLSNTSSTQLPKKDYLAKKKEIRKKTKPRWTRNRM